MSSLRQQHLKAWQPVLTPVAVIGMLLVVFVIFLPIGIVLEDASNSVVEQRVRYDNIDGCIVRDGDDYTNLPKTCKVSFTLEHDMDAPIYFYYELKNFYQNHRRFLASKSDAQLRGDGNDKDLTDCDPIEKYGNNNDVVVPCGLSPGAYFEDRFSMSVDGKDFCPTTTFNKSCYDYGNDTDMWAEHWADFRHKGTWEREGIAWDSDVDEKFGFKKLSNGETKIGPRQDISGLYLPQSDDEDFIVWMRTAALPDFRKLHRIISDEDLTKGDEIEVTIHQWFPVHQFGGQKWFVLGKTEWCGGANHSLAWTYIVVACVAIGLTVTFAILLLFGSRKMADVDRFSWHNRPPTNALVSIA